MRRRSGTTGARSGLREVRDERYVLAVDLGTGGPKVGFVSLTGKLGWHDHVRVETRWIGHAGAVQDADRWWSIICDTTRRGLASGAVPAESVVAVCVTGLWASTVPVDAAGEPVGEALLWMDSRGGPYSKKVIGGPVAGYAPRPAIQWIRRTGGAPSSSGADPIGHLLYLLHEEPEVARRAVWFLEPIDYVAMRFTGIPAASHASMTAAWLTDNRRLDVLDYDPVLVGLAGLDAIVSKLPPLVPTGSVIGEVQASVAADLGLPPGVAVVTSVPDLHTGACGAGAVTDYDTHLAISTSAWIGAPIPNKKTDAVRQIASVPGLSPDRYLIANNHETGGLCLEWLRDKVLASTAGFPEIIAEAESSAPGAGDILFTPWLNGERSPVDDRRARGGWHNLSLSTCRADLVRAVLEGVAFNNRWLHDACEHFVRRQLDPIRMIGGGAQSDLWCQIHADVMDRTIEKVAEPLHAGVRGAALFASMSLGAVEARELRDLVQVEGRFVPDPATRSVYDRLYEEFPKLYKSQRPMFKRLNGGAPASG
ncbi:MAG TPA: FGGY-family carbohydrate kinase [Acidimicrobiales bacterium]|nr:FGGY-family carbohydrate kinase [Acidimicrobiales bacterium]